MNPQIMLPINDAQVQPPFEFALVGRPQYSYLWIVVFSSILAFASAIGMGANDVSSSFAATVGSRTVSIRTALVLSAIFQILGAYFLGARVVKTVGKSVVNLAAFEVHLDLLMTGMMVVLIMTSIAILLATYKGFPISTTQCIISTIVGFGLASPGAGVNWNQVLIICIAWLVAPVLSATLSGFTFTFIRSFILRTSNPLPKVLLLLPLLTWLSVAMNLFFVLFVSPFANQLGLTEGVGIGICLAVGSVFAIILFLARIPLERRIHEAFEEKLREPQKEQVVMTTTTNLVIVEEEVVEGETNATNGLPNGDEDDDKASSMNPHAETSNALLQAFTKAQKVLANADAKTRQSVMAKEIARILRLHQPLPPTSKQSSVADDAGGDVEAQHPHVHHRRMSIDTVSHLVSFEKQQKYFEDAEKNNPQLHQRAEEFDEKAESAFKYLQIFTSITAAFAQGANSIGNITGPLSVIVSIHDTAGFVSGDTDVDEWVTWLGIAGLLTGLFMFGYIVLTSVGVKMIHVTPSRGFSIGLASSVILAIGSFCGLPLSTTHCVIGAITGIGLVEKPYSATGEDLHGLGLVERLKLAPVNWRFIGQVIAAWFGTVLLGLVVGSGLFSFITLSPSQIYPMNAHNCLVFYGEPRNQTNVSYVVNAPEDGFVIGIVGFSNNTVVPL